MKKTLAIIVLAISAIAFADHHEKKEEMKAKMAEKKAEVTAACAADAKGTPCEGKEVGAGLLKCLHEHKKQNKEFKLSEGCKASAKDLRDEKKELKKEWKAKKAAEKADK